MTNAEKFKAAHERAREFEKYCEHQGQCSKCPLHNIATDGKDWLVPGAYALCAFAWSDLEADEEKSLPCPFCGGTDVVIQDVGGFELACLGCGFHTPSYIDTEKLISEYQRVARAVMETAKKEMK